MGFRSATSKLITVQKPPRRILVNEDICLVWEWGGGGGGGGGGGCIACEQAVRSK